MFFFLTLSPIFWKIFRKENPTKEMSEKHFENKLLIWLFVHHEKDAIHQMETGTRSSHRSNESIELDRLNCSINILIVSLPTNPCLNRFSWFSWVSPEQHRNDYECYHVSQAIASWMLRCWATFVCLLSLLEIIMNMSPTTHRQIRKYTTINSPVTHMIHFVWQFYAVVIFTQR